MFDLDAAFAAQREAAKASFEFTYGGEKFAMPLSDVWPLEASALIANGDLSGGLRLILDAENPDQAQRFIDLGPALGHVKLILEEETRYEGLTGGLPNSVASARRGSTPT